MDENKYIAISKEGFDIMGSLSRKGQRMLLAVLDNYGKGVVLHRDHPDNLVIFNYWMIKDSELKTSKKVFTGGMKELCERKILSPIEDASDWYWIDTKLFFAGEEQI
jgi:fructose/tagatose bisphosphate aldolase